MSILLYSRIFRAFQIVHVLIQPWHKSVYQKLFLIATYCNLWCAWLSQYFCLRKIIFCLFLNSADMKWNWIDYIGSVFRELYLKTGMLSTKQFWFCTNADIWYAVYLLAIKKVHRNNQIPRQNSDLFKNELNSLKKWKSHFNSLNTNMHTYTNFFCTHIQKPVRCRGWLQSIVKFWILMTTFPESLMW